jgi:hypothetical protein
MSMAPAVINPLLLVPLKVSTPPIRAGLPELSKPLEQEGVLPAQERFAAAAGASGYGGDGDRMTFSGGAAFPYARRSAIVLPA